MPRLTPSEIPKSSAFTRSCRTVSPSPIIQFNSTQITYHLHRILKKTDGCFLKEITKENWHLFNLETEFLRNIENFDIKTKTKKSLARKNGFRHFCPKTFKPCLCIQKARKQELANKEIKKTSHHMARIQITKKGRADFIARFR